MNLLSLRCFLKVTIEEQLTRLYGREFHTCKLTILTEKNCCLIVALKFGVLSLNLWPHVV